MPCLDSDEFSVVVLWWLWELAPACLEVEPVYDLLSMLERLGFCDDVLVVRGPPMGLTRSCCRR